ncbi:MAG: glycosyltransferase family 39 protein [Holophagales bacterium]|nr:glycosyltransferase family 39 protein [Holophagales bacterium]
MVVLAAAAVRVAGWDNWSFWLDEAMQVDFVRRSFGEMWNAILNDGVHPPLDYVFLRAWRHLSSAESWSRTLPVLWSCLTVLAVYVRAGGSRHPVRSLAAASAFAAFPLAVFLGQEMRPYAAGICFAALFDAARSRYESGGRRSMLVAAGVFGVLASWTLYWAGLFVAFSWLLDLVRFARRGDRPALRRAALTSAVTFLLFVPWLVMVARENRGTQPSSAPKVSIKLVLQFLGGLAADRQDDVKQPVVAVIIWAFVAAGLVYGPTSERGRTAMEAALFSGGVLFALSITGHWWSLRYLAISMLPLSRAIGFFFERVGVWSKSRPTIAIASTFVLLMLQKAAIDDNARFARPDWRRPADYLRFMLTSGYDGPVVAADPYAYFTLRAQLGGWPKGPDVVLKPSAGELAEWIKTTNRGWVVRAPHFAGAQGVDGLLSTEPWGRFRRAEDACLFRVTDGRIVGP